MTDRAASRNEAWVIPVVSLSLVALVWAVFGQALTFGFVNYDDANYITENPVVQRGVTLQGLCWALTYGGIGHWHPLTWVSHMLDCQIYGLWAGGHHLTNVLLHGATVVCLFLVLRSMTGSLWRAAFVSAAWAIQPMRAESVAWISERKDVLSGLFFVLTVAAYVRYARRPAKLSYWLVAGLLALGLLAKNMLVTLPCVLLLLDYWPLRRTEPLPRLVIEKLPLFALSAGSCLATFLVPEKVPAYGHLSLPVRLENALLSYVIYLWQSVRPVDLAALYPNPRGLFPLPTVMGAMAVLAIISIAAVVARTEQPSFFVGWFWFAGMLLPTIGVVQISYYSHADRYTYLPQIGLYIAIVWGLSALIEKVHWPQWVIATLAGCVIAALAAAGWIQTSYWHDGERLWIHTVDCTEGNYLANNNLGDALWREGKMDGAIAFYREALKINPDYAEANYNLGYALSGVGRLDEAIAHYKKALAIQPEYAEAYNNLGNALSRESRVDEAVADYQEALRIKPDYADAYINLGNILSKEGRPDEAIADYEKALAVKPDYAEACNNLSYLLSTCRNAQLRDGPRAEALANRANLLTGGTNAMILNTLAAAYAEERRFPEAAQTEKDAIAVAEAQGGAGLENFLEQRLKLYQAGQPLRDK